MDNFDRLNKIREQHQTIACEVPSSEQNVAKARTSVPLPKIVAIILIAVLLLTAIYAFLHPIYKIKLKFFLFRNCTIEVVATAYGEYETKDVLIDGNLINAGEDYYEIDGDMIFKYVKTGKNTWQRMTVDEEWMGDLELGDKLLDKNNYKRAKGRLFAWRLKNSVAETIDDLSSITLERDVGKIAIMGYSNGVRISLRFTMFGKTKIDPPWEEPGMIVEGVNCQ
jgi:hypothetical protein